MDDRSRLDVVVEGSGTRVSHHLHQGAVASTSRQKLMRGACFHYRKYFTKVIVSGRAVSDGAPTLASQSAADGKLGDSSRNCAANFAFSLDYLTTS